MRPGSRRAVSRGYGPASKADLLRFAGLRAGDVNAGFEELEPRLVHLEAEDGRTLDLRRATTGGHASADPVPAGGTT